LAIVAFVKDLNLHPNDITVTSTSRIRQRACYFGNGGEMEENLLTDLSLNIIGLF
jgi:hypothetical protein